MVAHSTASDTIRGIRKVILDQSGHIHYNANHISFVVGGFIDLSRGGEVESRRAHNPEIAGAIPAPATNSFLLWAWSPNVFEDGAHGKEASSIYITWQGSSAG